MITSCMWVKSREEPSREHFIVFAFNMEPRGLESTDAIASTNSRRTKQVGQLQRRGNRETGGAKGGVEEEERRRKELPSDSPLLELEQQSYLHKLQKNQKVTVFVFVLCNGFTH